MIAKQRTLELSVVSLSFLLVLHPATLGQTRQNKTPAPTSSSVKAGDTELSEAQLPAFAVSLVIAVANEARSFSDLALRPRVLSRAADVLWDADNITAHELFKRAWEAAEKGDAEDVTVNTKDKPPAMVLAMRKMSGRDLRFEVLSVMARRDRAMSEEFFAKLKTEKEGEKDDSKKAGPSDGWVGSEAVSKRLQVAEGLLRDGQTEKAMEFAAPVLNSVNVHTISFLSELRLRNAAIADQAFEMLLNQAAYDPLSDANVVSGLSSYVFTPGLYVSFKPEGGVRWQQPDDAVVSPADFPVALRHKFFQVAATILLRPLSRNDPAASPGAREMKMNVIKRLLPLFEQYAPETAVILRAQLTEWASAKGKDLTSPDDFMVTQGIKPEPNTGDILDQMQSRIDRAKTSRERDSIYASAAAALLSQGDERARDVADKIEDIERRTQIRQYVDFEFIQRAIKKKTATEAIRLTQTGKLSNTQRASAYIDIARLVREAEPQRALELLEDALREIRRIEGEKPDRPLLLLGVANQLMTSDRVRAWEIMGEVVKEANRLEGFTGENTITFPLMTGNGARFLRIGGDNFSLKDVFRLLAKDDLYRAVDLAKSFKYEAARASVTLAIAGAILEPAKRAGSIKP